ncbi:MAG TPA: bifunctional [glutamate--ammonia ligase]-adenylyl-L-tyrosine phosphorylase/[glutamate--ammonia-ligase] adenylyltransferase [Burkholderiaceae bacterium]|nr:bifunctional [glutamate--ammonia ligase]-adenylyl-L-tyrosine phosphorylase/[glutamate--ammonia-ligase] adenylyltransferase [Burkholderiaceae bacterium]
MNSTPSDNAVATTADYSRYVQRVRRRFVLDIAELAAGVPDAVSIQRLIDHFVERGHTLAAALRIARHAVVERLVVLDVEQGAPLQAVTSAMTALAEVALERALAQALRDEDAQHGPPLDADGQRIDFWIVGMGKLGARELNVSSDIDLIYLYGDDGHTASGVSAPEYFARVAKRLHRLIGEITEEGFVFRIDLALRPNGNSGPPVASLAALETYFQAQGREWERFAWLKSRVIAPRAAVLDGRARALSALVTPFVYRRYLDYGVFEGLRQLHRRIREEAQRRAAGRPERANDVKLSRGGIREIEFIVQLLLVVRGGQFPEIRTRSTLRGLQRLVDHGLMAPDTAQRLADAYTLLRRIEHRIQYLDDQQSHVLPTADADLSWIARSMGQSGNNGTCALLDQLGSAREFVADEFDALLHDGQAPVPAGRTGGCKACGNAALPIDALAQQATLPPALAQRVTAWSGQARVQALREETKVRLGRLVLRASACVADGQCTEEAALRFIDWLEPLLRRESYVALLDERPEVLQRLLRLLGLARWPMQYLMRHPGVIDELADPRLLHERFDRDELLADLDERHAGWQRSGQADESALLDTLRHAHHAEVFRTLVRDVEGLITVEQVADDLSALADALIDCTLRWAWMRLKNRHRDDPRLAVIAYGKLGGKELGYGSDLDVVFLYDDSDEADADRAQDVYGAFVRKLITWMTLRTPAGQLFDIDTALRPNGNSGLLVTSIASFERYQQGRGSNTAWTWEHQALTRARYCAGCADLAPRFDAVRAAVLTATRDAGALAAEVVAMRERVHAAHPVPAGVFDVKHSPGGMMDAEFAVQYLVLAHSQRHPGLIDNVGNIALLQRAEGHGLLAAGVGQAAAQAYRELRRSQHRARLDEQPTQFAPAALAREREAVVALWQAVFG